MFTCLSTRPVEQEMAVSEHQARFRKVVRISRLFGKFRRRRGSQGANSVKVGRHSASLSGFGKTSRSADGQSCDPADHQRPPMDKSRTAEDDDGECSATAADMASAAVKSEAPPSLGAGLVQTASAESNDGTLVSSFPMVPSGTETKERKPTTRSTTQPPGTFTYTVDKNDTLTSVAARFQTTPSELVKINRLVSRFVFPGQVLFVPERESSEFDDSNDNSSDRERCRDSVNSNSSSGQMSQSSPKPGHAERVRRSPNTSPVITSKHMSEDEDLDRDCKEKFLKINVKHITDGAGVVSGTLLVTPNCVMFDPHVVDPLVKEHGVETYGVIAPMAHVANAALFNDIAIMKVRNAPQQQQNLPQPKIYYAKNCDPLYKRSLQCVDTDITADMVATVAGQPCRSESQQAVKGSVSDKADLDLSEEDEEGGEGDDGAARGRDDGDSIGSCHSDDDKAGSGTHSPADDNSEVFVAAAIVGAELAVLPEERVRDDSAITTAATASSDSEIHGVDGQSVMGVRESGVDALLVTASLPQPADLTTKQTGMSDSIECASIPSVPWKQLSDAIEQSDSEEGSELQTDPMLAVGDQGESRDDVEDRMKVVDAWWEPEADLVATDPAAPSKPEVEGLLQNGQVPGTRDYKQPTVPPPQPPSATSSRLGFLQFLPDGRWPLLSSPAAGEEEGVAADGGGSPPPSATSRLRGALTRKNSSGDVQSKLKVLKRLSNPLWGTDPLGVISGAPEKIKESLDLFSVSATLPRSASPSRDSPSATPVSPHPISGSQNPSLARTLLTGGGLFGGTTTTAEASLSLRPTEVSFVSSSPSPSPQRGSIALPSPSIDGWVDATKTLLDHRRGSSPEQPVCEAVNPVYVDMRRYSEVTRLDVRRFALGKHSREDIRVEFKSEITVDDKKDLFQNMDMIGAIPEDFELIPRPAKSCDDPPWYLRVRMGRPLNKKTPSVTPIMSYGKQSMRSEYWFSIPKDRIDELCTFFHHWAPGVYGDLNESELEARGMMLLHSDEDEKEDGSDALKEGLTSDADFKKTPSESNSIHRDWEIIKAPYVKLIGRFRRETQSSSSEFVSSTDVFDDLDTASLDSELPIADMVGGETEILTPAHRVDVSPFRYHFVSNHMTLGIRCLVLARTSEPELGKALPARAVGYAWSLIFNASQHGFSLQSMYRKMSKYETPVLLVIQDTQNNVFGALTSCTLRVSDHFYGTGEGFLFTFYPEFKVYRWTGDNVFFIKGNPESLAIGAGDGLFGLWLDGDLYHGRSHRCKTYNNETLSSSEDFRVSKVEAWGFMEFDTTDTSC